jgi:chaperonin cofactor prefoldin
MKTNLILIGVIVLLIAFGGIRSCQVKRLATEKATIKAEFNALQKQKETADFKLKSLKAELSDLSTQKTTIEQKLKDYTKETSNQIEGFKNRIRELNSLPGDTVYLKVFYKWPTFNQVLKYRFAENQVREMYLNVLERDHYLNLYEKTGKSLLTCTDLNKQNDLIIGNLSGQNDNLQTKVDLSELQIVNLQDNLQLSNKTLNKQKRKTFFYKITTIAGISGILFFAVR